MPPKVKTDRTCIVNAAAEKSNEFHTQYIRNYPSVGSEFLTYSIAYIHFAKVYPQLFEMIIQPGCTTMSEQLTDSIAFVVNSAGIESGLSPEQAKDLFFNIWIYTHGIVCLVYKGSIVMTEGEEKYEYSFN